MAALAGVWNERNLRRLTIALLSFFLVEWTVVVAMSVWAFERGGAGAVAAIGVAKLLPSALLGPIGAWAADRYPRTRVATALLTLQCAVVAGLFAAVTVDADGVAFGLVALSGIVAGPFRPTHLALLPLVARSPHELVAANVVSGVVEGVATLAGPAVAGAILLGGGPQVVLLAALASAMLGAVAVAGVRPATDPSAINHLEREHPVSALLGGFRVLASDPGMALIVGCFVLQLFVRGVLGVLLVVVSFELLDLGQSGVGWLGAAMGLGGITGAVFAMMLSSRRRLGGPLAIGLTLWGLPMVAIGLVASPVVALIALVVVGLGNFVLDVSGLTLLQRLADDRMLGRVFGVLFAVGAACGALGAVLAPTLVEVLGIRSTLTVTGMVLPLVAITALGGLRSVDRRSDVPIDRIELLAGSELFAPLPPTMLEKIASRAELLDVEAGEPVVVEGTGAERFYLVVEGQYEVTKSGRHLRVLGPGDPFGEIALIRRVPRTASVRAISAGRLLALDGSAFLAAICGNRTATTAADVIIGDRTQRDDRVAGAD